MHVPNQNLLRVALLCILTVALRGNWIIEQPRSSLLLEHYRMKHLYSLMEVWSANHVCLATLFLYPRRFAMLSNSKGKGGIIHDVFVYVMGVVF